MGRGEIRRIKEYAQSIRLIPVVKWTEELMTANRNEGINNSSQA